MTGPRIYLLRHGQTVWNKQRRLQGQSDSPLTDLGERQAHRLGEHLAQTLAGAQTMLIVTSPMPRARRTAEIICEALGRPSSDVRDYPLTAERAFGAWEGLTWDEIEERFPGARAAQDRDPWDMAPEGGESRRMLETRVRQWLDQVDGMAELILVSHRGFGMMLRGVYARLEREKFLTLEHRQDEYFLLHDGTISTITVP